MEQTILDSIRKAIESSYEKFQKQTTGSWEVS